MARHIFFVVMALTMLSASAVAQQNDSLVIQQDSIAPLRCDTVKVTPLTTNINRPYTITNGLNGHHIALWGSHGLYYEMANARWEWQRARMFNTVEDKLPSDYVINYLTPMLEHAGAVVMMPRERDANPEMVVVDNEATLHASKGGNLQNGGTYEEHNGQYAWQTGEGKGFAYLHEFYKDNENPFLDGTYRMTSTVLDEHAASLVTWTPDIPKNGRYAVYVSYKSFGNSATDAHYTVYHNGGTTTISVNQQMGGGTWIYLGTFAFDKGTEGKVVLSNVSKTEGAIVTADAVRFGGGMGNIARRADGSRIYDNTKEKKDRATSKPRVYPSAYGIPPSPTYPSKLALARGEGDAVVEPSVDIPYEVSGYPRYSEGARYYMQWAGIPQSVYSVSGGSNDYVDDYKGRSKWVNYLAGGSAAFPDTIGLNIPIDMSLAFHTDAGSVSGDKIIGTLGIYKTAENGGKLGDGSSRSACRDLTTGVYNTILNDIRKEVEPRWSGRGCVDKGYAEAASLVPAMLLELLSHESFGEMRYGNDPRFKFIVSRAIYKGILKFISNRYGYDYIVQPLPVSNMAVRITGGNNVEVSWKPVIDSLEQTAVPERYVVYKRIGDGDFDNGTLCEDTIYSCSIPSDKVVSFKVSALNKGGESMDSEIVSAGISSRSGRNPVLVINGFDRVSAPDDFSSSDDKLAGFLDTDDGGVSDGCDISYVGRQKEFRRSVKMADDDSPGFGASYADYEKYLVAGNTHDYAALHGKSILKAEMSFVSVSRAAVKDLLTFFPTSRGDAEGRGVEQSDSVHSLNQQYSAIDLILGKEKQTKLGRKGATALQFKTFDSDIQQLLTSYCYAGGRVFVSGSYIASDLWQNPLVKSSDVDRKFAQKILKYKWRDGKAATQGRVRYIASPLGKTGNEIEYWNTPNSTSYAVESPDAIIPAESSALTAMRYSENGLGAAVVFGGNSSDHWRTVILAFPFESIKDTNDRDTLMNNVLRYLIQ